MTLSDLFSDLGLRVHQSLYELTDGRVGHGFILVPTLLLRTTGRRTGRTRTSALAYALDGGDWIVVASNGGSDRPPGWLLNIEANPAVEVQVARRRRRARATVVRRGDARFEQLWDLVNDNNHGRYRGYQAKTSRDIPVVVLSSDEGLAAPG